jgi:hypothetical protein
MEPQENPLPEPEDMVGVEFADLVGIDVDALRELGNVLGPHHFRVADDDEVEEPPNSRARDTSSSDPSGCATGSRNTDALPFGSGKVTLTQGPAASGGHATE